MAQRYFSILGMKELKEYGKKLGIEGEKEARAELKQTAFGIRNDYRSKTLKHKDKGTLYNSITADSNDNWKTAEIGSTAKHALPLETGSRAHKIPKEPKPADKWGEWLKFFWDKIGMRVSAMQVNHPGTPPTLYLLTSFLYWESGFAQRLKARFDKIK
jgi:hypothetical protein